MKVVLALGLLAFVMQATEARPQFSVFNRQLFPSFTFRGQSSRPVSRPVQVQRPERPRFFSRPAPQRFVPQPSFSSSAVNRPTVR